MKAIPLGNLKFVSPQSAPVPAPAPVAAPAPAKTRKPSVAPAPAVRPPAQPIAFAEDADAGKVLCEIDLAGCLAGRCSTGRPGSFGRAQIYLPDGRKVNINVNVIQGGAF